MAPRVKRVKRVIKDAAAAANLTPGTLRSYEREGLLHPERNSAGHRLYSDRDIAAARRIAAKRAQRLAPGLRHPKPSPQTEEAAA